jgi:hypothetical protein
VFSNRAEHVQDNGSKYDVDDIAYWDENVTLGVDMEPDYLQHDKFYDPEQDTWIDAVKIGDSRYSPESIKQDFHPLSLNFV